MRIAQVLHYACASTFRKKEVSYGASQAKARFLRRRTRKRSRPSLPPRKAEPGALLPPTRNGIGGRSSSAERQRVVQNRSASRLSSGSPIYVLDRFRARNVSEERFRRDRSTRPMAFHSRRAGHRLHLRRHEFGQNVHHARIVERSRNSSALVRRFVQHDRFPVGGANPSAETRQVRRRRVLRCRHRDSRFRKRKICLFLAKFPPRTFFCSSFLA